MALRTLYHDIAASTPTASRATSTSRSLRLRPYDPTPPYDSLVALKVAKGSIGLFHAQRPLRSYYDLSTFGKACVIQGLPRYWEEGSLSQDMNHFEHVHHISKCAALHFMIAAHIVIKVHISSSYS